jgi:hypothetical protein
MERLTPTGFLLRLALALGLYWSLVQRRLTGQADLDEVDRR